MCGIAAIITADSNPSGDAIERMSRQLVHRGPDEKSTVRLDGCHLGHTRLSIIDLSGGHQPMADETERYWVVFNGEIFNYRELRSKLEKRGWHFRTQSDTEVLLRAYQQFGDKAVEHLNGQFAFLIWDKTERKLFGARDRMGEKPLYWTRSPQGQFLFASEIKALIASGLIEPRLDPRSVHAYLGLLYVPPHRTIYENVHTLLPAHSLSWQEGRVKQWAYWRPAYSRQQPTDVSEANEELRSLLSQAVRRQMVADVPIGAFLSGGLDSSTVVALMAQSARQPISTFSVGFGDLINELPFAREVAKKHQTNHHEIQMDIEVGEMVERMADVYDEPFADSSNIPTYLMAGFARRHVKVVLAGDGADEVFGGYDWYRALFADDATDTSLLTRLLLGTRWLIWRALCRVGLDRGGRKSEAGLRHIRASLKRKFPEIWERHLANSTGIMTDWRFLGLEHQGETIAEDLRGGFAPPSPVVGLDRATDFDLRCYLPGDILVKVDRAAMAHGLETRAPFLDVDLVEFVLGLPAQLRFKDDELKYMLRRSCSELWPDGIRKRSKQGFGAPLENWVRRPDVQALVRRVCSPGHALESVLPNAAGALGRNPQVTWTVLCLGLWLEKHPSCLNHRW